MARYFIEVAYKGSRFSGFQVQENAVTVQSEVEMALATIQRVPFSLTGSSRTDAGVHARQNYFHFDFDGALHPQLLYKMNAVLPADIVARSLRRMPDAAHARFDAIAREYRYYIYKEKDPFLRDTALFYPYALDEAALAETAAFLLTQTDFTSFSKTNTQVKNFNCQLHICAWREEEKLLVFHIKGNRFLRGMVRLLTATQLKVARGKMSMSDFRKLFESPRPCGLSVPPTGLFLERVHYPENYFPC